MCFCVIPAKAGIQTFQAVIKTLAPRLRGDDDFFATSSHLFSTENYPIPGCTSWHLANLSEFRGKQELYTRQAPHNG